MKNATLYRLNEVLFETVERLNDRETLTGEALGDEIRRADSLIALAQEITANAETVLKATLSVNNSIVDVVMPEMIDASKANLNGDA